MTLGITSWRKRAIRTNPGTRVFPMVCERAPDHARPRDTPLLPSPKVRASVMSKVSQFKKKLFIFMVFIGENRRWRSCRQQQHYYLLFMVFLFYSPLIYHIIYYCCC